MKVLSALTSRPLLGKRCWQQTLHPLHHPPTASPGGSAATRMWLHFEWLSSHLQWHLRTKDEVQGGSAVSTVSCSFCRTEKHKGAPSLPCASPSPIAQVSVHPAQTLVPLLTLHFVLTSLVLFLALKPTMAPPRAETAWSTRLCCLNSFPVTHENKSKAVKLQSVYSNTTSNYPVGRRSGPGEGSLPLSVQLPPCKSHYLVLKGQLSGEKEVCAAGPHCSLSQQRWRCLKLTRS